MPKYNSILVQQLRAASRAATRELNDQLYPLVVAGDKAAAKKMIEANSALAIAKVDSFLRVKPEAEYLRDDLVSAALLGLTKSVSKLAKNCPKAKRNPTGYVSRWVQGFILNCLDAETGNRRRKRSKRRHVAQVVPLDDDIANNLSIDPRPLANLRELLDAACLDSTDRQIVERREAGYSDHEIASALNLSPTTIHNRRRGIEKRYLAQLKDDLA